jgi:glutaredoxin 3
MRPIQIYTSRYCPYCTAAKRLLSRKGVGFTEIDVDADFRERRRMRARANGRTTVPQIFIGSRHVGGFDDLRRLDQQGKLDALVASENAAAASGQEPRP